MNPRKRQGEILKLLEREGGAKVTDLGRHFSVSEVTIRKDLEKLEAEGGIFKGHGGAFLKDVPEKSSGFSFEKTENVYEKQAIGRAAEHLIENRDTLIIDSGTTTMELANEINQAKNLIIITNSVPAALRLANIPSIEIHITGGEVNANSLAVAGPQAADFFESIHVDKLFLSAIGLSFKTGLVYSETDSAIVKKAMIQAAEQVYLLLDSSKFEKKSFSPIGAIEVLDFVITDSGISPANREALEKMGIEVIIANRGFAGTDSDQTGS